MKWKSICLPFASGGLGVKNLIYSNQALLGKWLLEVCYGKGCFLEKIGGLEVWD